MIPELAQLFMLAAQNPEMGAPMLESAGMAIPGTEAWNQRFGSGVGNPFAEALGPTTPHAFPPNSTATTRQPTMPMPLMGYSHDMEGMVPGASPTGFNSDPNNPFNMTGITPEPITPEGVPQPPSAMPQVPAQGQPTQAAQQPARNPAASRFPQVRMPQIPSPEFRGGVAGAQKAPDFGGKPGASPAQALMMALLGQGGGQKGANPLRVPALGALLNG